MTTVKRVSLAEMLTETGAPALGYSQPQKDRVLLVDGLPAPLEKEVLSHEFAHAAKGEEGPWLLPAAILGAGAMSWLGADKAADAQSDSANSAMGLQREQFNTMLGLQMPWIQRGNAAGSLLAQILGLNVGPIPSQYGGSFGGGMYNSGSAGKVSAPWWSAGLGSSLFGHVKTTDRPLANADALSQIDIVRNHPAQFNTPEEWRAYMERMRPGARAQLDSMAREAGVGIYTPQKSPPPIATDPNASDSLMARLQAYPGFQFAVNQATQAAQTAGAAAGSSPVGGNVLSAISNDVGGRIAPAVFGDYMNRLQAMAGYGQTATNVTSGFGQNTANNLSNLTTQAGDARASGIMGKYGSLADIIGAFGTMGGQGYFSGWGGGSSPGAVLGGNGGYQLLGGASG